MAVKIQIRRDSAINWTTTNPVLAQGELGLELDTGFMKAGNGTDNWNDLAYLFELTGDLIPLADNASDIGSATKRYKDGYFKGKLFTEKVLSGDIPLTDSFYNTSRTITIPAPDAGGETIGGVACHTYIQNVIDSLPKFIPSETTITLLFSAGTYIFADNASILISGFFGGGVLDVHGSGGFQASLSNSQTTILQVNFTAGTFVGLLYFGKNTIESITLSNVKLTGAITADYKAFIVIFNSNNRFNMQGCWLENTHTIRRGAGIIAFAAHISIRACYFDEFNFCSEIRERTHCGMRENSTNATKNTNYLSLLASQAIFIEEGNFTPTTAKVSFSGSEGSLFVSGNRTITTDSV